MFNDIISITVNRLFRDNISGNNSCTCITSGKRGTYYKRSRLHIQILTRAADVYFDGGKYICACQGRI